MDIHGFVPRGTEEKAGCSLTGVDHLGLELDRHVNRRNVFILLTLGIGQISFVQALRIVVDLWHLVIGLNILLDPLWLLFELAILGVFSHDSSAFLEVLLVGAARFLEGSEDVADRIVVQVVSRGHFFK